MSVSTGGATSLLFEGIGLITGDSFKVRLELTEPGTGAVFRWEDGETLAPDLSAVVSTDHGITLANASGRNLSIVEHFLGAMAFCGITDWILHLPNDATELPLLDGSANEWAQALLSSGLNRPLSINPQLFLPKTVELTLSDRLSITASPATRFAVTYQMDLDHPDFTNRTVTWTTGQDPDSLILQAQTFGWVDDLPRLLAMGLARGVNADNTLGLTREGGYTRALRFPDEPLYHKMLDCIGDLSLMGINPLQVGMHITARNAGHTAHVALSKALLPVLTAQTI